MPESRCQCESQRMCSKARSPDISFASMRISSSERKGVVCARQRSAACGSRRVTARKKESASVLFIQVSCGVRVLKSLKGSGEFIRKSRPETEARCGSPTVREGVGLTSRSEERRVGKEG